MQYDVTILTEARYLNPTREPGDWYTEQVLTEDQLLHDALTSNGLRVQRRDWADSDMDWKTTRSAIFRTTWDYFHRFDKFKSWLEVVSQQTTLFNAESLIRWNLDKHYLQDLKNRGVNIVDSTFIKRGDCKTLSALCDPIDAQELILKPTISGAARHTYRITSENVEKHEAVFRELIEQEDMMLQPFQYNILKKGELSLMVMDGTYTHAVRKRAKANDFRVQDDFGGSVETHQATESEIEFALQAVNACEPKPLYARVDIIEDNQSQLAVSELELIEPELWFRENPKAADVLAAGIARNLAEAS